MQLGLKRLVVLKVEVELTHTGRFCFGVKRHVVPAQHPYLLKKHLRKSMERLQLVYAALELRLIGVLCDGQGTCVYDRNTSTVVPD